MDTLFLRTNEWDLTLDSAGNIAMAGNPYSVAQDAASACRTAVGDLIYAPEEGIPYFTQILGQLPPLNDIRSMYIAAAMAVPGVAAAQVFFSSFANRQLSGQLQVTVPTVAVATTRGQRPDQNIAMLGSDNTIFVLGLSTLG